MRTARGLTLIELLIGIGVVAILIALIAPSMRELIVLQRLKSINAEFMTDLQYARSEAVVRNRDLRMHFMTAPDGSMTCYVLLIYAAYGACDCTRPPGSVCGGMQEELRTTQVPSSTDVRIVAQSALDIHFQKDGGILDNAGARVIDIDRISGGRGRLRTTLSLLGRPTVCTPDASINGVAPC